MQLVCMRVFIYPSHTLKNELLNYENCVCYCQVYTSLKCAFHSKTVDSITVVLPNAVRTTQEIRNLILFSSLHQSTSAMLVATSYSKNSTLVNYRASQKEKKGTNRMHVVFLIVCSVCNENAAAVLCFYLSGCL